MLEPIRNSWRRWQADRHARRGTDDLSDHLLRDIGLERDAVRPSLKRRVLEPGR